MMVSFNYGWLSWSDPSGYGYLGPTPVAPDLSAETWSPMGTYQGSFSQNGSTACFLHCRVRQDPDPE